MVLLALDYGEKRIGVAVTDESGKFVKPLDYIPNKTEPRRITAKDFKDGITPQELHAKRKENKNECKVELRKLCNKLLYLINCYYPEKIIVGLPTVVDNETGQIAEGMQAKKVRRFVKTLESCLRKNNIALTIEFLEESMSSKFAEENLKALGITTSEKIREKIDSESAKVLLEDYISSNTGN
jgi:RNase H-fold protein (predicted Holliday junction resolvase)